MDPQYQTISVLGHLHVIKPVSREYQRGDDIIADPNYMKTGMGLCGILRADENLNDWIIRTKKR